MVSIKYLNASNGSGEAVKAIVQSSRSIGATTLIVDSVADFPAYFIATSGVINGETGYFDPATMCVFLGHLSGANIIIDSFAPGYTDNGNSALDAIVLKPTTKWVDQLSEVLNVSLNDNGTLKDGTVGTGVIVDKAATLGKIDGGATAGRLITTAAGVVSSLPPIGTIATLTGNQNVTNSTPTALTFNAAPYSNTVGVSGTQVQIQATGLYIVTQTVQWAGTGTGVVNSWIQLNTTTSDRFAGSAAPNHSTNTIANCGATVMYLTAGDYLQLIAFQTSGGTIAVSGNANSNQTMMTIARIA